jgi:hypothetical protein
VPTSFEHAHGGGIADDRRTRKSQQLMGALALACWSRLPKVVPIEIATSPRPVAAP